MKKISLEQIHYSAKESLYFEDYIFSILEKQNAIIERNKTFNLTHDNFRADAFLPNGFPGITNSSTVLEIKYTNNKEVLLAFIKKYLMLKTGHKLVIVSLLKDNDLMAFQHFADVCVLGSSFVETTIYKYPSEWWIFVALCSGGNQVRYDESDNTIHFSNPPLAAKEIAKEISIVANDDFFESISIIGEVDFKKRIKYYGEPALFVGNGVSVHFGSDSWETLSNSLFNYLKPEYIEDEAGVNKAIGGTNYALTSMSKYMIDNKKYYDAIYYSLYRKYRKTMHIDSTLLRSVSIIKHKYPLVPVITYNYDNFLEMDYELKYSSKMRSISTKRQDNKFLEPKIIHIHGIIPFNKVSKHSSLILTQEEYYSAYKAKSWVVTRQKNLLTSNICLFVGSSMSDLFQMSVIEDVRKRYYSVEKPYSWKCFALLCLKDMSPKDITAIYNYYFSKGVHIIIVEDFKKLPQKLLSLFGL